MTTAVILAGGLGTRLRAVLPNIPKPMAPIHGRPFLEYQIDYWISQGVSSFILSVGYLCEQIIEHFGSTYKNAKIDYVIEKTPLGTGGGLILALDKVKELESFLLLNGDTFFEIDLSALKDFAQLKKSDWCFSLFNTFDTKRYMGLSMDQNSKIIELGVKINKKACMANGGVYWVKVAPLLEKKFTSKFTSGVTASLEDHIFKHEIKRGKNFYGYLSEGKFIDIGVPEDYISSHKLLGGIKKL